MSTSVENIEEIKKTEETDREAAKLEYLMGFGKYLRDNLRRELELEAYAEEYFSKHPLGCEIIDEAFAELIALDENAMQGE